MDSTGRTYALPAHSLASARGYGEPLTGRLNPPAGASFVTALLSNPDDYYLLASDAGYGFVCRYEDLLSRNKAGKAMLTLPKNAGVLPPIAIKELANERLAAVSSGGRMLVFPVQDLPQLSKGKGNKIIALENR